MIKPFIALSTRSRTDENTNRILYDNDSYNEFVRLGGGIGSIVYAKSEEEAKEIAKKFDGLLITGGEDVNPILYHEKNTDSSLLDTDIEESDIFLYHAFKEQKKPILGICRGLQIINVIEGGTLLQDIKATNKNYINHSQYTYTPPLQMHDYAHLCSIQKNTQLYRLMNKDIYKVNSFHHQAISKIAPNFIVSAISEDGLIEAIEKENILAVQWHPERLTFDEGHLNIAKYFIEMCNKN